MSNSERINPRQSVARLLEMQEIAFQSHQSQDAILHHLLLLIMSSVGAEKGQVYFRDGASVGETDRKLTLYLAENQPALVGSISAASLPNDLVGQMHTIWTAPLDRGGQAAGLVWLAFENDPQLSPEEEEFLQAALGYVQMVVLMNTQNPHPTEAAVKNLRDAVILTDADDVIRLFNPVAAVILNTSVEDALGRKLTDVIQNPELTRIIRGTYDKNPNRYFIEHHGASYQPVVRRLKENGQTVGLLLVLAEVSYFKRLYENMDIFLQTVSHDLRSPLTAAKGFLDMLSMVGDFTDKQAEMRDKIQTSIVDMTNLVEKVLDAGRLDPEMGAYELRREMCDPGAVAEKVVSNLMSAAQKKHLKLSFQVGAGLPMMNLDQMMIERALVNLVENAIKYTPEDGEVIVKVFVDGNNLIYTVEDNGLGIPADKINSLFEKGSRVRREEHRFIRGSGLGLFIVKNVAEQHGGIAAIESEEGEGSVFRIVVPITGQNAIGGEA